MGTKIMDYVNLIKGSHCMSRPDFREIIFSKKSYLVMANNDSNFAHFMGFAFEGVSVTRIVLVGHLSGYKLAVTTLFSRCFAFCPGKLLADLGAVRFQNFIAVDDNRLEDQIFTILDNLYVCLLPGA